MSKPDVTTDYRVVSYGHSSQDRGVAIYSHVVFEYRVSWTVDHIAFLVILKTLGTECNTLIQTHMFAYDASFANNHSRSMVDTEIFADIGTGMYVYTGFRVSQLSDYSWQYGYSHKMQFVGTAIMSHGIYDRVAVYHLTVVIGSGVALEHSLHVSI